MNLGEECSQLRKLQAQISLKAGIVPVSEDLNEESQVESQRSKQRGSVQEELEG